MFLWSCFGYLAFAVPCSLSRQLGDRLAKAAWAAGTINPMSVILSLPAQVAEIVSSGSFGLLYRDFHVL
jgi:hypothetical protein